MLNIFTGKFTILIATVWSYFSVLRFLFVVRDVTSRSVAKVTRSYGEVVPRYLPVRCPLVVCVHVFQFVTSPVSVCPDRVPTVSPVFAPVCDKSRACMSRPCPADGASPVCANFVTSPCLYVPTVSR